MKQPSFDTIQKTLSITMKSLEYYLGRHFPVHIRELKAAEGGGWLAYIPALGAELFRDDGDTLEEALSNLENLRVALITDMCERGEAIPDPADDWDADEHYSGVPGLRIPKSLHRELAQRAKSDGISLNQYLNNVLQRHIGQMEVADTVQEILQPWSTAPVRVTNVAAWGKTVWEDTSPSARELPGLFWRKPSTGLRRVAT